MADATGSIQVFCPECHALLAPSGHSFCSCHNCSWDGHVLCFSPRSLDVNPAEAALPEDAVCTQHPAKRAVAVCAGTGDYICALCALQVEGETYSAHYVNTVGRDKLARAFDRKLQRPDSTVLLYCLLCFIPYVNVLWYLGAPVWVPLGYYKLVRAARLRASDPLLARVITRGRLAALAVILALVGLLAVAAMIGAGLGLYYAMEQE
jgi:hypothetical protein